MPVVAGVHGWVPGTLCAPVLVAGRVRGLFASVPGPNWGGSYALWTPVPAAVWGFVWGVVVSVSPAVRRPTEAAPLHVAGVDGIVAATAVSLLAWPALLLYVLPRRGLRWYDDRATTVPLVLGWVVWYVCLLAGPAYALSVFAGFGQSFWA